MIAGLIYVAAFCGVCLALLAAIGLIVYFGKYKHILDVTSNISSPPTLPLIGHGHHFLGKQSHEFVQVFKKFCLEYGPTYKLWIGPSFHILLGDVRDVEEVLGSTRFNDKAHEYAALEP